MIQITITYDEVANTIQVTGPIDNKMLSYAILESAKDSVRIHAENKLKNSTKSNIVIPMHNSQRE